MHSSGPGWIDAVRGYAVPDVAAALGLGLVLPERPQLGAGPCPACRAELRHTKRRDKRGAIYFRPDGLGWLCFQCDAKGDAVDLVAFVALGRKPNAGDREDWRQVRACAAGAGLCERENVGSYVPTNVRTNPQPARGPATSPAPKHPPASEVLELWAACRPVTSDPEVTAWFEGRKLDAGAVETLDLVRALPPAGSDESSGFQSAGELARPHVAAALPRWARFQGMPWDLARQGYRAIFPLYDHAGQLVSLRARAVRTASNGDKSAAAAGFEVRGLVLADALARGMLAGEAEALELVRQNGLVVLEGEPDFLTWATRWGDAGADRTPAVLGLVAGSWSAELAARVPAGAKISIRTHTDDAGERYARRVIDTLGMRCDVRRLRGKADAA